MGKNREEDEVKVYKLVRKNNRYNTDQNREGVAKGRQRGQSGKVELLLYC